MAVVNATPDSFSDRERLTTTEARAARCFALLDAGADLLDLGGQSGITGVPEISEDEEASRVVPLVEAVLDERPDTIVSVDTYRPEVVRAVVDRARRSSTTCPVLPDPNSSTPVRRPAAAWW